MPIKTVITKGKVPVKVYTDDIEHEAYQQLLNIAQLPFVHSHIAAMPDVHYGKGATVGSVILCKGAIIPAAVGVDIGCGMNALRLSIKADELPDNLRSVRSAIEAAIPVGFEKHKSDKARASTVRGLSVGLDRLLEKHPKLLKMQKKPFQTWVRQLGTLGGGNHFIEICLDENDDVWIMLHSGSRGVGNIIGQYYIRLAQRDMGRHVHHLPDKDLAYFREGADHFDDYVDAVHWAQDYAMDNRREMMRLIVEALKKKLPKFGVTKEAINCHHNYVSIERSPARVRYVREKVSWESYRAAWGLNPTLSAAWEIRNPFVPVLMGRGAA
jgi:tRNA-splicing ligase RtcB